MKTAKTTTTKATESKKSDWGFRVYLVNKHWTGATIEHADGYPQGTTFVAFRRRNGRRVNLYAGTYFNTYAEAKREALKYFAQLKAELMKEMAEMKAATAADTMNRF